MTAAPLSVVAGPPLADEPGLGELTIPGWFRSLAERAEAIAAIARPGFRVELDRAAHAIAQ